MADQTVSNAAENQDMGVKEIQLTPVLHQTDEKGDFLKSLNKNILDQFFWNYDFHAYGGNGNWWLDSSSVPSTAVSNRREKNWVASMKV